MYKNFIIFFVLFAWMNSAVIKEDDTNKKESFDDIVKRVYSHIEDVQKKERKLEYQSLVPYYMPFGQNQRYYIPLGNSMIPHGGDKMSKFSYDPSQNRYGNIYNNYFRMLNKNLEFLHNIKKYQYDNNDTRFKQLDNPESFEYDHYFDGFNDHETMSQNLPILFHKKELREQAKQEHNDDNNEQPQDGEEIDERRLSQVTYEDSLKSLQRKLKQINKNQKKLQEKQQYLEQMKNFYQNNYPEIVNQIGLLNN